jgi:hypothetical protein
MKKCKDCGAELVPVEGQSWGDGSPVLGDVKGDTDEASSWECPGDTGTHQPEEVQG